MSVLDHYIELLNVGNQYNIPNDITRTIFEYEKKNIMKKENLRSLIPVILKRIHNESSRNSFSYHLSELKYKNVNTIFHVRVVIENLIRTYDLSFKFSHYCCTYNHPWNESNNSGLVFINHHSKW